MLKKDLNDRVKTAEIPVKDICEANYGSLISEELRARVKTAPMASMLGGYRGLFRDAVTAECLGEAFGGRRRPSDETITVDY